MRWPWPYDKGFRSIAFPLIGAGSGGFNQERAKAIMEDELGKMESPLEVRVVVFGKGGKCCVHKMLTCANGVDQRTGSIIGPNGTSLPSRFS